MFLEYLLRHQIKNFEILKDVADVPHYRLNLLGKACKYMQW